MAKKAEKKADKKEEKLLGSKAAKGGKSAKGAKDSKGSDDEMQLDGAEAGPSIDELEEQEEAAEEAAARSSGGTPDAALAAAVGSTESTGNLKNFRHHPDMENFYRFIHDNDLRLEALHIMDQIMAQKAARKAIKAAKSSPH